MGLKEIVEYKLFSSVKKKNPALDFMTREGTLSFQEQL